MKPSQQKLRRIPGVDKLLEHANIKALIEQYNESLVKYTIREVLQSYREQSLKKQELPNEADIPERVAQSLSALTGKSFRRVINATGVIVNTNLGRAPYGEEIIKEAGEILKGYNNLEFDLAKGSRGSRNTHLAAKLRFLTGAEDVLVVNNNAAALILILNTLARDREVIVSRGELIEIGGSFRIPEIMAAGNCLMKEVGSTNKTHLYDYEKAICENTGLIFKAHKSNYVIRGFTAEVHLADLVSLGKKHKIPVVFDMGSGLLRKTGSEILKTEPDVRQTLALGIDMVTFSGDKLIGGPQAGIIAGDKKLIALLKKNPLLRALRIGKTTMAFMETALSHYLDDDKLLKYNNFFKTLHQSKEEIKSRALMLETILNEQGVKTKIEDSEGFCGGGAMPEGSLPSFSLVLVSKAVASSKKNIFAEKIYLDLLKKPFPVVGVLKKGQLHFDMITVSDEEVEVMAENIIQSYRQSL